MDVCWLVFLCGHVVIEGDQFIIIGLSLIKVGRARAGCYQWWLLISMDYHSIKLNFVSIPSNLIRILIRYLCL